MKTMDGWNDDVWAGRRGVPGRPEEDRFWRRMEIYEAVAPLVETVGARDLTMQQAAEAAYISIGTLYYYFSSKRELLLFPILPGNCAEFFRRFQVTHADLLEQSPRAFLDTFIEAEAKSIWQIRPAVRAALELGIMSLWELASDEDVHTELRDFLTAIRRVTGSRHDPDLLAAAILRQNLSAVLDQSITREQAVAELRTLIYGEPLRTNRLGTTGNAETARA